MSGPNAAAQVVRNPSPLHAASSRRGFEKKSSNTREGMAKALEGGVNNSNVAALEASGASFRGKGKSPAIGQAIRRGVESAATEPKQTNSFRAGK